MKSSAWLQFFVSLILGLAAGMYYAWVINPVEYVETAPASMHADYQADYRTLVALAYAGTGDLDRARARLAFIPDPNPAGTLSQLAQTRLAAGRPEKEARSLALLAAALGERPTPLADAFTPVASSSITPTGPTKTPTITRPPPPTRTPTSTPGAPFEMVERQLICDPDLPAALIQIEVLDAAGRPVPGVEALVVWDEGQDHFFTGLKPELGVGYADFTMQEGVYYTIQLVESGVPITGLIAEDCASESGDLFPGSWLLTFQQPAQP